ncbi:MAG: T4-like virus tail tube protein gp19 [Pelotomaculum sp. PtaB.Bin104]|nr:MAG: T4-like virus tail tube protein gp19 [Pelotomaculum sp. PtaB.Bin104]
MYDPSGSFRFWVEIDGLFVGGFTEVSGLRSETEVEEYREGGVNTYVHRFPKVTKYPSLVLKRGVTNSVELWNWYKDVAEGIIERKNGSVVLLDQAGDEIWRWNFFDSYPVKWIGPELKASRAEIAVEVLEIVHNGLKGIAKE